MTVSAMPGRQADTSTDWFDGLDDRLPVALLRFVAASSTCDLGSTVSAVMELAHRRTSTAAQEGAVPVPTARSRRSARRAVVEPRSLPADIGRRFLTELGEVAVDRLPTGHVDTPDMAAVLSELLAVRLGVPLPVSRAALAVALSVECADTGRWTTVCRIPYQRQPDAVVRIGPGRDGAVLSSPVPAPA